MFRYTIYLWDLIQSQEWLNSWKKKRAAPRVSYKKIFTFNLIPFIWLNFNYYLFSIKTCFKICFTIISIIKPIYLNNNWDLLKGYDKK